MTPCPGKTSGTVSFFCLNDLSIHLLIKDRRPAIKRGACFFCSMKTDQLLITSVCGTLPRSQPEMPLWGCRERMRQPQQTRKGKEDPLL